MLCFRWCPCFHYVALIVDTSNNVIVVLSVFVHSLARCECVRCGKLIVITSVTLTQQLHTYGGGSRSSGRTAGSPTLPFFIETSFAVMNAGS